MPSAHRMMNLITSFGFVYKTFQNMFAMHDRASEKPQTPGGRFHPEPRLGVCHLLPLDLSTSVSPSKKVHINLSHTWSHQHFQPHFALLIWELLGCLLKAFVCFDVGWTVRQMRGFEQEWSPPPARMPRYNRYPKEGQGQKPNVGFFKVLKTVCK